MEISPITYLHPETVLLSLDGSVDMGNYEYCFLCGSNSCENPEAGDHIQAQIESLLNSKLQECTKKFRKSCAKGIKSPICIEVAQDGSWWQGNGHHRLIVALEDKHESIPVVFSFDGDYMHEETTENDRFPESDGVCRPKVEWQKAFSF